MVSGGAPSIFLAAGIAAPLGAAGCATTGLAWVHEPESGADLSAPTEVFVEAPPASPSVRRLDHTITLGETTSLTAVNGEPVDPRGSAPSPAVINIYVGSAQPAFYGPAYGVVTGVSRFDGVRTQAARATALRPGLDWAPPPSYGPAFPYRMAPSSPWSGDGSERTRGK